MDPGAVLLALLGSAEPVVARTRSSSSTTRRSVRTPSPAPAAARPSCASRARPRRSSPRRTATRRSARSTRGSAPRCSVAEATRNVSITGARPLGVTNCLNYGDPTRPEAFWQLERGRPRARPTRAGRSACRSPAATSRSTTSRRPARSRRHPEIGVVGLLDDIATLVGPAFAAGRRRDRAVGETTPGLAGSAYAALAGRRRRGRTRRRSTSRARSPSRRSSARPSRAGSSRPPRTCRAAAWRSRSPSARCGAASARRVRLRGRALAGRRPVRREPVAAGRQLPAALRRRRSSCWPASTACRSRRSARSAASASSSSSSARGATGAAEERGSDGSPTRSRSRSTTSATPGTTASARALGWEG